MHDVRERQMTRQHPGLSTFCVAICLAACACGEAYTPPVVPPPAPPPPPPSGSYQAIDLGSIDNAIGNMAVAVDSSGRVVGTSGSRPFLWQNGVMTELAGRADGLTSA